MKYPKPNILLIDVEDGVVESLEKNGYNVDYWGLGNPYKVDKSDSFTTVIMNHDDSKNISESEVIVIDQKIYDILEEPEGEKSTPDGIIDVWASNRFGIIDPRPRSLSTKFRDLHRIHNNGGPFIIFADEPTEQKWVKGRKNFMGSLVDTVGVIYGPLDFLPFNRRYFQYLKDYGKELTILISDSTLGNLLKRHINKCHFGCFFDVTEPVGMKWEHFITNKYGQPVSGLILFKKNYGPVFVFPQFEDKAQFLAEFLSNVLPEITPELFPHHTGFKWMYNDNYEMSEVSDLRETINQIKTDSEEKIEKINDEIQNFHEKNKFLYDLLTATGDELKDAVNVALTYLGFKSIIDSDKEGGEKLEDLRIEDSSPMVLIEVKGISGKPSDDDVLAAGKYVAPRMKKWRRTNVTALTVINYQKNIPPFDRGEKPFRNDLIVAAEAQEIGILTTFDLYKIIRSFNLNNWDHNQIKELFYKSGIINPIPTHYELLGKVNKIWKKSNSFGVPNISSAIDDNDVIAFDTGLEFVEQEVGSLQIDEKVVKSAEQGQNLGIKLKEQNFYLRKNMVVYRVRK